MERINRTWVKENTRAALVLDIKGEVFLALVAALHWASQCGPGPSRRRHGLFAYQRIVSMLPVAPPETILAREELLAAIDGLEHFTKFERNPDDPSTSVQALSIIKAAIERESRSMRKEATA